MEDDNFRKFRADVHAGIKNFYESRAYREVGGGDEPSKEPKTSALHGCLGWIIGMALGVVLMIVTIVMVGKDSPKGPGVEGVIFVVLPVVVIFAVFGLLLGGILSVVLGFGGLGRWIGLIGATLGITGTTFVLLDAKFFSGDWFGGIFGGLFMIAVLAAAGVALGKIMSVITRSGVCSRWGGMIGVILGVAMTIISIVNGHRFDGSLIGGLVATVVLAIIGAIAGAIIGAIVNGITTPASVKEQKKAERAKKYEEYEKLCRGLTTPVAWEAFAKLSDDRVKKMLLEMREKAERAKQFKEYEALCYAIEQPIPLKVFVELSGERVQTVMAEIRKKKAADMKKRAYDEEYSKLEKKLNELGNAIPSMLWVGFSLSSDREKEEQLEKMRSWIPCKHSLGMRECAAQNTHEFENSRSRDETERGGTFEEF